MHESSRKTKDAVLIVSVGTAIAVGLTVFVALGIVAVVLVGIATALALCADKVFLGWSALAAALSPNRAYKRLQLHRRQATQ